MSRFSTTTVTINIPRELLEGLQEIAMDENVSVSHLVRRMIVRAMCFEEDEDDENRGNALKREEHARKAAMARWSKR